MLSHLQQSEHVVVVVVVVKLSYLTSKHVTHSFIHSFVCLFVCLVALNTQFVRTTFTVPKADEPAVKAAIAIWQHAIKQHPEIATTYGKVSVQILKVMLGRDPHTIDPTDENRPVFQFENPAISVPMSMPTARNRTMSRDQARRARDAFASWKQPSNKTLVPFGSDDNNVANGAKTSEADNNADSMRTTTTTPSIINMEPQSQDSQQIVEEQLQQERQRRDSRFAILNDDYYDFGYYNDYNPYHDFDGTGDSDIDDDDDDDDNDDVVAHKRTVIFAEDYTTIPVMPADSSVATEEMIMLQQGSV